jgi:hypothetical protein
MPIERENTFWDQLCYYTHIIYQDPIDGVRCSNGVHVHTAQLCNTLEDAINPQTKNSGLSEALKLTLIPALLASTV